MAAVPQNDERSSGNALADNSDISGYCRSDYKVHRRKEYKSFGDDTGNRQFFLSDAAQEPGRRLGDIQESGTLFLVLIPVISGFVLYSIIRSRDKFLRAFLGLILGGAIGNYIDRLAGGKVIDFMLFYIGSYPFPVFNAADIAVTCGTILLAVYVLFIYKEPNKADQDVESNEE